MQADEYIAKPSDFLSIKNSIDNLIVTKYNPARYVESLHQLLRNSGLSKNEIKKLDTDIYGAIKARNSPNWREIAEFSKNNGDLLKQITTLGNTILKFFQ